jgi:hypothetical protein
MLEACRLRQAFRFGVYSRDHNGSQYAKSELAESRRAKEAVREQLHRLNKPGKLTD